MEKPDFAEDYLNKKQRSSLEKLGSTGLERIANAANAEDVLSLEFFDIEYGNEGEFSRSFEKNINGKAYRTNLSLAYNSICDHIKVVLQNTHPLGFPLDLARMKKLTYFKMESDSIVLDSNEMPFPDEGTYFFDLKGLSLSERKKYMEFGVQGSAGIIVGAPPNTPMGIVTLFHELGHFWRADSEVDPSIPKQRHAVYRKFNSAEPTTSDERAIIMEEERGSWAASIKELVELMKPICDTEEIINYMHFALAHHAKNLQNSK